MARCFQHSSQAKTNGNESFFCDPIFSLLRQQGPISPEILLESPWQVWFSILGLEVYKPSENCGLALNFGRLHELAANSPISRHIFCVFFRHLLPFFFRTCRWRITSEDAKKLGQQFAWAYIWNDQNDLCRLRFDGQSPQVIQVLLVDQPPPLPPHSAPLNSSQPADNVTKLFIEQYYVFSYDLHEFISHYQFNMMLIDYIDYQMCFYD